MKTRDVLIVGAGIAGCALALAMVKRGVAVTILTSSLDQRVYHAPFIQHDRLEETLKSLQKGPAEFLSCSRAHEQLLNLAGTAMDELLESNYKVDRFGNVDVHNCLKEQLEQNELVEWKTNHSLIELLTLEKHSTKKADAFKKPTCVGIVAYDHQSSQVEHLLAKEIILATGGAASLYPFSTHSHSCTGEGIAIAKKAGVRLINMGIVEFHPLGLYEKDRPCYPLPVELLMEGGNFYADKGIPLAIDIHSPNLAYDFYEELKKRRKNHFWLDLSHLDPENLKNKFPGVDNYCLNHGFNIAKDPLPILPVAASTCGGVVVDRVGQTNLLRLRAIGEISCTGLFYHHRQESLSILESLTWAVAAADDIHKQISKLAYYFPNLKTIDTINQDASCSLDEDWHLLKEIMWLYVGINRDFARVTRGILLLEQLLWANQNTEAAQMSVGTWHLIHAIETALTIARSSLNELV